MLLEIGDAVRYRGLGAGRVTAHRQREFRGDQRLFAVIVFPHRDMTAQVLLGDPRTTQRLEHVLSAQEASRLLEIMTTPRMRLSRTWDQREEIGERLLNSGAPHEWVSLLAAYAEARGRGLAVSSSDQELVREACELIAAEISCAIGTRYAEAYEEVRTAYQQAFETHRRKAENEPRSVAIA